MFSFDVLLEFIEVSSLQEAAVQSLSGQLFVDRFLSRVWILEGVQGELREWRSHDPLGPKRGTAGDTDQPRYFPI